MAIGTWGLDWAWSLPLIILTVVFHTYGLGLLEKDVNSRLFRKGKSPPPFFQPRIHNWRDSPCGHFFARVRGSLVGGHLPRSWSYTRLQVLGALLTECDDEFWPY